MNISDLNPCDVCALEGYPYAPKTCQTCPNAPIEKVEKESEPMKRTWKDKLTSRKLWLAVATFVTMLIIYCTGDTEKAEKISAIIMAGATVIGYMVSEGLTDSAHKEE